MSDLDRHHRAKYAGRHMQAGVFAIVKDVFLPWYNAYRFLVQNIQRWEQTTGRTFQPSQVCGPAYLTLAHELPLCTLHSALLAGLNDDKFQQR